MALKVAMLAGTAGGNKLGEKISAALPIDEIGFSTEEADNTAFYVGKYLSPKLYVRYGLGLIDPTSTFFLRYKLSEHWSFESENSTRSSAADFIFTLER